MEEKNFSNGELQKNGSREDELRTLGVINAESFKAAADDAVRLFDEACEKRAKDHKKFFACFASNGCIEENISTSDANKHDNAYFTCLPGKNVSGFKHQIDYVEHQIFIEALKKALKEKNFHEAKVDLYAIEHTKKGLFGMNKSEIVGFMFGISDSWKDIIESKNN